jgi:hypothetical protein
LLLGADGRESWVRGQCDIGIDYRSYHQRAIVANFACEKPHHNVAHQWFTCKEGIIALLPLPGNQVSLVWSAPETLADTIMNESLGELAIRLGEYSEDKLGLLKPLQPESVKAIPLALVRPHAITAPHVALIGDAAHAVHPLAGHGMNLGFARSAPRHRRRARAGALCQGPQGRRPPHATGHRRARTFVRRQSRTGARCPQFRIKLAGQVAASKAQTDRPRTW